MNQYEVLIGGRTCRIAGHTLQDAIYHNFTELAARARVGNAAGYNLSAVTLSPAPEGTTIGGKPFTCLYIDATGKDLAHRPAPAEPKRTTIHIIGKHVEVDTPLTIGPPAHIALAQ